MYGGVLGVVQGVGCGNLLQVHGTTSTRWPICHLNWRKPIVKYYTIVPLPGARANTIMSFSMYTTSQWIGTRWTKVSHFISVDARLKYHVTKFNIVINSCLVFIHNGYPSAKWYWTYVLTCDTWVYCQVSYRHCLKEDFCYLFVFSILSQIFYIKTGPRISCHMMLPRYWSIILQKLVVQALTIWHF